MKNKNLRSKVAIAPLMALVVGVTVLVASVGWNRGTPRLSDQLFATKIAGCYMADVSDGSLVLWEVSVGGSTFRENSVAFIGLSGLPNLPFHRLSGGFGNWTRTGRRSIRNVDLAMAFDEYGQVSSIFKVTVDVEFSADFQSGGTSYVSEVYLPEQDPLTDVGAPGPSGYTVFRKIQ